MPRFNNVNGEIIQFTEQEEADRDAEETTALLDATHNQKKQDIIDEGVSRIAAQVPEWGDLETIRLIKSFINLMDFSKATPEQILAKDIHDYARAQIVIMKTATQTELDAYDPASDPQWPD